MIDGEGPTNLFLPSTSMQSISAVWQLEHGVPRRATSHLTFRSWHLEQAFGARRNLATLCSLLDMILKRVKTKDPFSPIYIAAVAVMSTVQRRKP